MIARIKRLYNYAINNQIQDLENVAYSFLINIVDKLVKPELF